MTAQPKPPPLDVLAHQPEESRLPFGHCCFLLREIELKGRRCGCTHFNLNRIIPGALCDCGHLACYHVTSSEQPLESLNQEMLMLKQRLEILEREQDWHRTRHDFDLLRECLDHEGERNRRTVVRLSNLEEAVEKSQAEFSQEVQKAYHNLGRAWDSITDLMEHKALVDNSLRNIDSRLGHVDHELARIGERQLELVDIDIVLEERVDGLDSLEERMRVIERKAGIHHTGINSNKGRKSKSPSCETRKPTSQPLVPPNTRSRSMIFPQERTTSAKSTLHVVPRATASTATPSLPIAIPVPMPLFAPLDASSRSTSRATTLQTPHELWTVHISLLPTLTQPFAFERDTNAYKRCLSRGLHQMVAVNGPTADEFTQAVEKSFGHILRGRKWVSLQALPCTAERLAGLPMLRPLDASLIDRPYDRDFLRNHCAVCDASGRIDSLYIAMCDKTLSWHSIRRLPVFLEGLDPSWVFDHLLDANDPNADDDFDNNVNGSEDEVIGGTARPSAGDIVATLPSLKRAASKMSRSSSFGPANATAPPTAEAEGPRPKVTRIVEVRRSVKTS